MAITTRKVTTTILELNVVGRPHLACLHPPPHRGSFRGSIMSFHRSIFVALATVFAVGMSPAAFAQCCGGYQAPAPVYYAPAGGCGGCGETTFAPAYTQTGCGGCGAAYAAPAFAQGGCGTCGATAYAPIVYATPIAPAPISVGYGCGTCGTPTAAVTFVPPVAPTPTYGCGGCGSPAVYTQPAPLYVVNQGPDFTGPGVTVPYETYAPPAQYAPPPYYPSYYRPHSYYRGGYAGAYRGGYGGGYYRHAYYHPHAYYGGRPYAHRYWRC
jgi:hypothetical protein